jgi:peptidoglycan/xylan/chitin deacetylase (PgdA/CDA1 family)
LALWVNPNIEFFGLDDVTPGNLNERVPREHARIPNVRIWAVRDYGNPVGIWRIMEVLTRYGIRASAALNGEVCDHHPEIIEEAGRLGWELIGHNQTNALRLTEMDETQECGAVWATIDRIEAASGRRPVGSLGAGLAETWNTLDYLAEAGALRLRLGQTTTSGTSSRSATRRWCRCPIRYRPTTFPHASK